MSNSHSYGSILSSGTDTRYNKYWSYLTEHEVKREAVTCYSLLQHQAENSKGYKRHIDRYFHSLIGNNKQKEQCSIFTIKADECLLHLSCISSIIMA